MSFRNISRIARCSHGSVSAEKKAWLHDPELAKLKEIERTKSDEAALASSVLFPDQGVAGAV